MLTVLSKVDTHEKCATQSQNTRQHRSRERSSSVPHALSRVIIIIIAPHKSPSSSSLPSRHPI
eukprot:408066-Rhodomonas_salina.1